MTLQASEEIKVEISNALEEAVEIVSDEADWTMEKKEKDIVIKSKVMKHGRKIWLCKAKVNVSPEVLERHLLDIDNLVEWNSTLTESRVLKTLSRDVFITYKVTAEGAGGLVSARDFLYGATHFRRNGKFIIGGKSVDIPEAPSSGGRVRAVHGPSCQIVEPGPEEGSSLYTWLMDCDYRGCMPASIVNIAMPIAQIRMVESINKLRHKQN